MKCKSLRIENVIQNHDICCLKSDFSLAAGRGQLDGAGSLGGFVIWNGQQSVTCGNVKKMIRVPDTPKNTTLLRKKLEEVWVEKDDE